MWSSEPPAALKGMIELGCRIHVLGHPLTLAGLAAVPTRAAQALGASRTHFAAVVVGHTGHGNYGHDQRLIHLVPSALAIKAVVDEGSPERGQSSDLDGRIIDLILGWLAAPASGPQAVRVPTDRRIPIERGISVTKTFTKEGFPAAAGRCGRHQGQQPQNRWWQADFAIRPSAAQDVAARGAGPNGSRCAGGRRLQHPS